MKHTLRILLFCSLVLLNGSCSKMLFSTQNDNKSSTDNNNNNNGNTGTGTGTGTTVLGDISCSAYFNNQQTSVTVTTAAQNPTLTATCTPSNVTLGWIVRDSNGTTVSISGLQGAQSTPDFYSAGNGTYSVTLQASAPQYTTYVSSPLTATVAIGSTTTLTNITCDVRVNNQYNPVTLSIGGSNPHFTASCTPAAGSYVWTVTQADGTTITVPGLTGSDSTPDFLSMNPGTYSVSLQVTQAGYNAYRSSTPLKVTVPSKTVYAKTSTTTVKSSNNKLDVLLIVDDSNSMLNNNLKLAAKLKGFVDSLSTTGFDWQMCVTVTRALKVSSSDPNYYWGASVIWSGNTNSPTWILKSGTANVDQIFSNTITKIGAGWAGSEDERPLKAAWWSLWNGDYHYSNSSGCYREDAGLAMVLISNEDERSIGGDITQKYYSNEYYVLENDDLPQSLLSQVKTVFGSNKRFVFNSILVRPSDNACMSSQDAQGTKSHYGVVDAQMANLTGGYVGSICDADYSPSLNYFKNQIVNQMKSVILDCAPVGTLSVSVSPTMTYTYSVSGSSVYFDPAIPVGSTININYNCAK